MGNESRTVASAESGTFTQLEPLQNSYTSDISLQRALKCNPSNAIPLYSIFDSNIKTIGYLPTETFRLAEPHLAQLGEEAVSPEIHRWNADAEVNQPYVKKYNVWGQRYGYDRLVTSEGWKQLGKWGTRHG